MIRSSLAIGALMFSAGAVSADTIQFFGHDLNTHVNSANVRLPATPQTDAAQASFHSNLINVGTETLQTFSHGTTSPIVTQFGGGRQATLSGQGSIVNVNPGLTNGAGRYSISGSRYWEVSGSFALTFNSPIAAFGFTATDIGDFNGQITLTLHLDGGGTELVNIGNGFGGGTNSDYDGSALFYGLIRTEGGINKITFGNTAAGTDVFAFDDFTIGGLENIQLIPLPSAAGLAMAGMGVVGIRRRRQN